PVLDAPRGQRRTQGGGMPVPAVLGYDVHGVDAEPVVVETGPGGAALLALDEPAGQHAGRVLLEHSVVVRPDETSGVGDRGDQEQRVPTRYDGPAEVGEEVIGVGPGLHLHEWLSAASCVEPEDDL